MRNEIRNYCSFMRFGVRTDVRDDGESRQPMRFYHIRLNKRWLWYTESTAQRTLHRAVILPPQAPWAHCPYRCRPPVALAGSAQFSWFLAFPRTVARFPFPHVHILHVLHDVVQPLSEWAIFLGFPPIAPNRPTIFFIPFFRPTFLKYAHTVQFFLL